ncbi:TrkH family potassium uptake protein, partial [Candidatus Dependentiae bacterium]|nr:TrkH family potassium uptake protein [Candidatus Dependentiae bacterium]
FILGLILKSYSTKNRISLKDSMFICSFSWIILTIIGAIPYVVMLKTGYIDALFEAMSGFTTTGATILTGLDEMPRSILFWRAFTQWIGGLGILSMFILIGFKGGAAANKLFIAESHKIAGKKPSPGAFHTAKVLWELYIGFTLALIIILKICGVGLFDAMTHSFTTISTGGFSIYDNSITQFQILGYQYHHIIEIVIIFFMILGGMNFFIHSRILKGDIKSLWDSTEVRYFWGIILGSTLLILISYSISKGLSYEAINGEVITGVNAVLLHLKDTIFQVVSILTTTGYATRDINSGYFTPFAKQLFLILMLIGGCAGSTSGGFKVIRVAVLSKLAKNKIYKLNSSSFTRAPLTIDNEKIEMEEITRITVILFLWILLLIIGGAATAFFSKLSAWQSISGMFSALGNIGPSFISVQEMIELNPIIKLVYIFGMLAGRLEILPVLIIFNKKFFK